MQSTATRRLVTTAWVVAVVATALNGVVVGYGAVWIQFFGETADAEDYRISAGGYGAAAAVLALAVVGILTHRASRWPAWVAGMSAAALALLAAGSVGAAGGPDRILAHPGTVLDGVGYVVWAPWTWALVALGAHGLYLSAHPPSVEPRSPL